MAPRNPSQRLSFTVALLFFFALGLMSRTVGVSTPTPILTIKSPDGDVIQCISRDEQPSLRHPSLQNHKLQSCRKHQPIWYKKKKDMVGKFDTPLALHVPKVPSLYGSLKIAYLIGNMRASSDRATRGHQYAIAYVDNQPHIYGTKATINVWDPIVESPDDFSLAQVWLTSGKYETNDLNTIEAGWQVYPNRYGDHQPRLFTYWTRDAYLKTGCYSLHCQGFVQISRTIALEAAIRPNSTIGGDQFAVTIQIWKDPFSGNWWLGMGANVVPVGYWPAKIFTTLSDHAAIVQWGGEVLYRNSSGMSTVVQMGSGEFAEKGFRNAACFCNLKLAGENRTFLPVQEFQLQADHPDSYTIESSFTRDCGQHFYYGGPGPGPVCSTAVPRELVSALFVLFFAFCLVV